MPNQEMKPNYDLEAIKLTAFNLTSTLEALLEDTKKNPQAFASADMHDLADAICSAGRLLGNILESNLATEEMGQHVYDLVLHITYR